MLAIKKHPLSLKAVTLGAAAFIIGLTGAAAYIDRFRQYENLVFSQEETLSNTSDTVPTTQSSASAQNTDSSQATASPQVAGSTPTATAPSSAAGSIAQTPAPSAVSSTPTTSTFEPGRGAGAPPASGGTTTSPTPTDPLSPVTDSCLLQNCVTTTLQDATNDLLGQ